MKTPRQPRTIFVDHLKHGEQIIRGGIFRKKAMTCDYDSPEGIVREFYYGNNKKPEYKILKTGELVLPFFTHAMIEEMDDMDNPNLYIVND